jgi:HSP20 family molecular chaperone IbpA
MKRDLPDLTHNFGFDFIKKTFESLDKSVTTKDDKDFRYYEVDVTGFGKDDLTLSYNKDTDELSIKGKNSDANNERDINIKLTVESRPADIKVEKGVLSFKTKLPKFDEPDDGFEKLEF